MIPELQRERNQIDDVFLAFVKKELSNIRVSLHHKTPLPSQAVLFAKNRHAIEKLDYLIDEVDLLIHEHDTN